MSNWFKDLEKKILAGLEHGIDAFLDSIWAHNDAATIEAKVNHYIETSPLAKLLGVGAVLAEGQIDAIIERNDTAKSLQMVKDYIHGRLLVK